MFLFVSSFICLFCFCSFPWECCFFFWEASLLKIGDINSVTIGWCRQCKIFYAQIVNINSTSALLVGSWVTLINLLVLRFDIFLLDFLFFFLVWSAFFCLIKILFINVSRSDKLKCVLPAKLLTLRSLSNEKKRLCIELFSYDYFVNYIQTSVFV